MGATLVLDMSKIRINELARELEVPNGRILELLPELGVTEKKTHSSSIDDDVAIKIRRIISGEGVSEQPERAAEEWQPEGTPETPSLERAEPEVQVAATPEPPSAVPEAPAVAEA